MLIVLVTTTPSLQQTSINIPGEITTKARLEKLLQEAKNEQIMLLSKNKDYQRKLGEYFKQQKVRLKYLDIDRCGRLMTCNSIEA
jgi:hypothetical protein